MLGFNPDGGFWLIHSAPKFPDSPANASYGGIYPSQTIHAQSFVCISLDAATLDEVSDLLQITDLYIYSPHELSEGLAAAFPKTASLLARAKGRHAPLLPTVDQQNLTFTSAGLHRLHRHEWSHFGSAWPVPSSARPLYLQQTMLNRQEDGASSKLHTPCTWLLLERSLVACSARTANL